ncbi:MAG: CRISPR-associated endonuclease Cas1 [Candidatus Accumulibacter sp.]|nr:CRISPR-associated endonuclease Cas1 [Accumulibacter sp.]
MLFHNLLTLVAERGLDPCLGSLHAADDGHPALVAFACRAQESIFEGWLDWREQQRLAAAIDAAEDRVALCVLAPVDRDDALSLGRGLPVEEFRHALL